MTSNFEAKAALILAKIKDLLSNSTPPQAIVLNGPRGAGATMIARRIVDLLPPLTEHQESWLKIEYNAIDRDPPNHRPFRVPHHTISANAVVGMASIPYTCRCGGIVGHHHHDLPSLPRAIPRVGELALARFGVLFLDEFEEFPKAVVSVIGEQLQRMHGAPLVVLATTSCPCGQLNGCKCSDDAISKHVQREQILLGRLKLSRIAWITLDR